MNPTNKMRPVHPGEVLREEFLVPLKMSAHRLALELRVPAPRINEIVRQRRAVTPDTALRLARFSAQRPSSGSTCSRVTISRSPSANLEQKSPVKCAFARPRGSFRCRHRNDRDSRGGNRPSKPYSYRAIGKSITSLISVVPAGTRNVKS